MTGGTQSVDTRARPDIDHDAVVVRQELDEFGELRFNRFPVDIDSPASIASLVRARITNPSDSFVVRSQAWGVSATLSFRDMLLNSWLWTLNPQVSASLWVKQMHHSTAHTIRYP